MSKNEVVIHLGATSSGDHGDAASERKLSLAAELVRGLNQTKRQSWRRGEGHAHAEAECGTSRMRRRDVVFAATRAGVQ